MPTNGKQHPRRPRIQIVARSAASPAEAAAIAAAIEHFLHDTAPASTENPPTASPWLEAALLEGTGREPEHRAPWEKLGNPSL